MADSRDRQEAPSPLVIAQPGGADGEDNTVAAPLLEERAPQLSSAEDAPPLVAGRYELLGMLGAGGMGTVYRARDRELDEIVALKIVRKELAASPGMLERFKREVKLARRVTHRNVARTFDIGEHAGDRFLTMELIEGEMLGSHIARRGRLPARHALAIGRDVCAGLAAAHAAGVLHRDLKPENVIIAHDGRAVITDFGIACAVAQGELRRTGGGIIGTPAYMAPEQVDGTKELDGRADLYALGTMLYELLSATQAWGGDSLIAVAAGRLLRPPPDVRDVAPDVPAAVAATVLKLMARRPVDRFSSAEEAGEALAALAGVPGASLRPSAIDTGSLPAHPGAARKSVAVLPLVNLGDDGDDYLVQTLTEDLVDLLSVVPALRVRPRGDSARFTSSTRDVREIGRTLDVDVVVDGSLRRFQDTVRVSIRLLTVEDGFQLWARRFDRPASSILTVADDAAAAVARALATELRIEARPAVGDAVAQDLYLRGRFLLHHGWFARSLEGVEMLREAHERAPDDSRIGGTYALAMSRVLTAEPNALEPMTEARRLAEKVLLADPLQSEARVALGFVHLNGSEGAAAATELKRALALNPNAIDALDIVGRLLVEADRWKLGFDTLRRALAIEPNLTHPRNSMARALVLLGDEEAALEIMEAEGAEALQYLLLRARIVMWRGDREGAAKLLREVDGSGVAGEVESNVRSMLTVCTAGEITPALEAELQKKLSAEVRFTPRRSAFHAQMRTELRLAGNDVEGALIDLRIADSSGLLDLMWLDRCPLLERVRDRPEFIGIRQNTAARAARMIEILEPDAAPYV